ncbi:DNA-binding NarL/FixJ family response regulator [Serratia sp. BIGb0234]|uniref:helix-turn-helix transcriptional regulator n=1 Tax=Serratia sp. BIGb0234 TaxID=2940614 RepID=UPI002168F79A|nr:LuxR C-terminal-related transcriptional regulator [Serratia sp. BIGb0234]MCS4320770.1 DNA-binding NarL/FixJ family response regulator [Serratia sp. BIGb0234]
MEIQRHLNVSIVGDSPLGVLGLKVMLDAMGIPVRTVKERLGALSECEAGKDDAVLVDIYLARETMVWLAVEKLKSRQGGRFVIFGDGMWTSGGGITFIRRSEQPDAMKKALLQGIIGGQRGDPKVQSVLPPSRENISVLETFVLSEWMNGRTVTEIARRCNRSVKTISAHKRNAMKKLRVRSDCELYWRLKKERV